MWELFKDLLMRVQNQYVPVRRKDKDGKKDMEDSEICVQLANMLGHFEIIKEVALDLLKNIKVNTSPGPNGIYPRLLRKVKQEIAGALIFVSSLATGEVLEDLQVPNVPLFKKRNRDNPGNYD
eukprot:g42139.t1